MLRNIEFQAARCARHEGWIKAGMEGENNDIMVIIEL